MGKTDEILNELSHQRDIQGKIFDEIKDVRKDVNNKHLEVINKIAVIDTKVEVQKVKASILGVIGGAIPTGLALAWLLLKGYFKGGE